MDLPTAKRLGSNQQRTDVACRRCHQKKVKCDRQGGIPCTGCRSSNTDCVRIESQRGRYVRKKPRGRKTRPSSLPLRNQEGEGMVPSSSSTNLVSNTNFQSSLPLSPNETSNFFQKPIEAANEDDSRKLYLDIADQGVSSTPQPISREKGTLFLGESFSLTYVVHDVLAPFLRTEHAPHYRKRLHFPVDEEHDPSPEAPRSIIGEQKKLLQERNICVQPNQSVVERLLESYFKWFHPAYPVIEREVILRKLNENQLSLLLLNAVLLIAVTVCGEADLALLGARNRHQGRELFYRQARVLYETDSDPDKLNNVVAVFLMSFWWGGPNDQKDSWHWLGIAVSSAQNLGMHRSTAESHMPEHRAKMWRRIWWCIRIRDALVSSSIGRPQHFSIYDCDVEILSPYDLEGEFRNEPELHYACQMARLCSIFSNIIFSRYAAVRANNPTQKRMKLEQELDEFHSQVPKPLRYNGISTDGGLGIWAAMLLLAHDFGAILLSRPPHTSHAATPQPWGNHPRALAAANEVTRVIEDILSLSMGRVCQIHTIPALFNSLAIHVFTICTSRTIERQLAENRARTCMLGLMSLQESWPVSGWILRLFVYIMERLNTRPNTLNLSQSSSGSLQPNPQVTTGSDSSLIPHDDLLDTNIPGRVNSGINPAGQHPQTKPASLGLMPEHDDMFPDLFLANEFGVGLETCNIDFFDLLRFPSEIN